jgi:glucose/arabinose dehydrogenase
MRPGLLLPFVVAAVALISCGDSGPESPSPDPGGIVTIRGNERLGWDQQAASRADVARLRFAIYIDDARSEMPGVSCEGNPTPAGFPCSARLPSMTAGVHTLELAAFVVEDDRVIESARSAPFRVSVSPAFTAPGEPATAPSTPPSSSTVDRNEAFSPIASAATFNDITSVAVTPDGWLLVAERAGVLRAMRLDEGRAPASIVIDGTIADGASGSLVSVAVDPEFTRTRIAYVLQTASSRNGLTWQLARYRQAGDVFGERAVLLEMGEASGVPKGLVKVGPDGRLYVALEDAGDVRRPRETGEREGIVLRLNPDGTTPADQLSGSPVFATSRGEALGLDWNPETGAMWMALSDPQGSARLVTVAADRRRARAALAEHERSLSPVQGVSGIMFYDGGQRPSLRGTLLIAADTGLHGARLDPQNGQIASIYSVTDMPTRAVSATPDGQLVIATSDGVFVRAR